LISLDRKSRRDNNYKEYSEQVLEKLVLIVKLKNMGFTLNEIDTFVELWREEDANCKNLKYTLENKVTIVNTEIQKLTELRERLSASITKCNNNDCEFEKTIPSCLCQ
jgi:DNA-binding transcriptional MerR regulator